MMRRRHERMLYKKPSVERSPQKREGQDNRQYPRQHHRELNRGLPAATLQPAQP